jgi:hypothetical protein
MSTLPVGAVAPDITTTAHRTSVLPDRAWVAGRPAALLFHGRDNQDAARAVVQTIRNAYPYAPQLVTLNIVNLSRYPRVMRKLVTHDLDVAYETEVRILPGDRDVESHVVIVPDYSGEIARSFGVCDSESVVSGIVIGGDWRVQMSAAGPGLDDTMMATLRRLLGPGVAH